MKVAHRPAACGFVVRNPDGERFLDLHDQVDVTPFGIEIESIGHAPMLLPQIAVCNIPRELQAGALREAAQQ